MLTIAKAYEKKKWTIPMPAFAIKIAASFLGRFAWFPITKDQITMLLEGNVCDSSETFNVFNIEQTPFNTETLHYLKN
jgi:NADH dehydrogenase